ncbi:galactose oxidase [Mycena alexandri]|uniref:Galactose oxidase n=1 Tax=Mycena alexandri TaxID=1745969 RepID=A0AAD6T0K5_9AGAR|nr:galactose oxidase [Mycena alexandri]
MVRSTSEMLIHSCDTIGDVPPKLIGASTAISGSKLYLFGGSLPSASEPRPLARLYELDLELWKWKKVISAAADDAVPRARCFHTMDIWRDNLVVCGGLGVRGSAHNDVQLFSLSNRRWLPPPRKTSIPTASAPITQFPRPRHSHLSCVSVNRLFIMGGKDSFGAALDDICVYDLDRNEWTIQRTYPSLNIDHALAATSQFHVRALPPHSPCPEDTAGTMKSEAFFYSEPATNESPCDIYLYNFNFVQQSDHPQGKLHIVSCLPGGQIRGQTLATGTGGAPFSVRFPSGAILATTLILAGNHPVDNTEQLSFCIWTLDLTTNHWMRLDTGELLNGSWGSGYMWHEQNKFFTFGKRAEKFVDGAQGLILGWDAVSVLDFEALGVYHPPPLKLDAASQKLGLASLTDGRQADFAFLCDDGRRIPCSRQLIMERWPWLRERHAGLSGADASAKHGTRTDMTLTETSAAFSQSYPVTMALLQYLYSLALGTALQRAPAVLSYLLLISSEFRLLHLQALVRHAMHLALTEATAEGVYEIAASCGCRSLQIR